MACFVAITFSIPLCSLQTPLQGRYAKKSASCRLPSLETTKTGIARKMKNRSNIGVKNKLKLASYFQAPCISNKGICSFNSEHHLNTPTNHFEDTDSCSLNVSSCTPMVIIGYWVGPDIDDGWGFVEACIYQSS